MQWWITVGRGLIEAGGSKIWFTVSHAAAVFDARGTLVQRARASDLRVGLWVEAVARGVLLDSYPQQALADTIVILR